jgi:hypothetical protein
MNLWHQTEHGSFRRQRIIWRTVLDAEACVGHNLAHSARRRRGRVHEVDRCARAGTPICSASEVLSGRELYSVNPQEKKLYERLSFGLPPVPARHLY